MMIEIICQLRVFLVLSILCFVAAVRDWDPAITVSVLLIIAAFWAMNWLLHHISLRWLRYLRYGFWVAVVAAIVLVPQLREIVLELGNIFLGGLPPFPPERLIVLAIVFLITHAVLCWSRPAVAVNA
jgi:hypothetical protein